jgi:hypothetical protein
MLYKGTELKYINPHIGFGVFATGLIPKGSVVYITDPLEIILSEDDILFAESEYKDFLMKYSYQDHKGAHVLSWDNARFVNHNCEPNSLSTGYGFEIAVRDIHPGEELTDDYGMFMGARGMACSCGAGSCRKYISSECFDAVSHEWDKKVVDALRCFRDVEQPLMKFMDEDNKKHLMSYLETGRDYKSVVHLNFLACVL